MLDRNKMNSNLFFDIDDVAKHFINAFTFHDMGDHINVINK